MGPKLHVFIIAASDLCESMRRIYLRFKAGGAMAPGLRTRVGLIYLELQAKADAALQAIDAGDEPMADDVMRRVSAELTDCDAMISAVFPGLVGGTRNPAAN